MAFLTIIKVSFVNSVRRPAFYITVSLFAVLIFLSHFFTLFTLDQPTSMVREVGVSSIFLSGVLLAIFISIESLAGEIESGTLDVILTKPASRASVLLAKFTGSLLTVWAALAVLTLDFAVILAVDSSSADTITLQAVLLAYVGAAVACAISNALATVLPYTPAVFVSLCLFAFGSLSGYFHSVASKPVSVLLNIIYCIVPDYDALNLTSLLSTGAPLPGGAFALSFSYGIFYTASMVAIACFVFTRREIK